ncbi:MAG: hypothetical protein HRT38_14380 [Alteromonadaceae bacterium]|nr:hypothetical protein [Alteromonadaceae bacterium]
MNEVTNTVIGVTTNIAVFVVYINLGTFLIAAIVGDRKSSPFITILCLTLANCISSVTSGVMVDNFEVINVQFMRHLWYISLASINIITMFSIYHLHVYYGQQLGRVSHIVIFSSAMLVTVQMIEYVPRILFNVSSIELNSLEIFGMSLSSLYSNGITVINLFLTVITVLVVFFCVIKRYKV